MKNLLIVIVALVVIGGAAYVLTNSNDSTTTDMPAAGSTSNDEMSADTMDTSDDMDGMDMSDDSDSMSAGVDVDASLDVDMDSEAKVFTVDSFNFGYSMDEIVVNEGDTVTIQLTNSDGFHDWVVDEFNAATDKIREGDTTSVTFVASKAGSYEYYCSVGSHRANGMVGTLVVQ